MDWLPVFVDSGYELRSGWRFAIYSALLILVFFAASIVLDTVALWIDPSLAALPRTDLRRIGLSGSALFLSAAGVLLGMARGVDRVPTAVFGTTIHSKWLRDFGMGVVFAGGMLCLTLAGSFIFGDVQIHWVGAIASLPAIVLTLSVFLLLAANEELVFRGYPMQVLMKGMGPWGSMLWMSFLFALLHAGNPGATTLSLLNTMLAGVMLSIAYLKTRSLWLPYGIHVGWNAGLGVFLGYPVSGLQTSSFLATHVSGSETIVGGTYGPEDGILGTVVFLAGAIAIYWARFATVSPELRAALAAHAGKVYIDNRD